MEEQIFWFEKMQTYKLVDENTKMQIQDEREMQIQKPKKAYRGPPKKKMQIQNSEQKKKPRGYKSLHASEFIIISNAGEK